MKKWLISLLLIVMLFSTSLAYASLELQEAKKYIGKTVIIHYYEDILEISVVSVIGKLLSIEYNKISDVKFYYLTVITYKRNAVVVYFWAIKDIEELDLYN